MKKRLLLLSLISTAFAAITPTNSAFAWGKRGHALVCESGAYLASYEKPALVFLKQNSTDLAYYCNVPDLIWKRPKTFKSEFTNHFFNIEAFRRKFGDKFWSKGQDLFTLKRKEFNKLHPDIPAGKGRSWWRLQELDQKISEISNEIIKKDRLFKKDKNTTDKKKKSYLEEKNALQEKWLTLVGVSGHYIADLAVPLHTSENYDGQLTGQEGLHHYFEETMTYGLYLYKDTNMQNKAYKKALKMWPKFLKDSKDKKLIELLIELTLDSHAHVPILLKIDKETGRDDPKKSFEAYKDLVVNRLSKGILYYAYFIRKHTKFEFNTEKYYNFNEKPKFIKPPR